MGVRRGVIVCCAKSYIICAGARQAFPPHHDRAIDYTDRASILNREASVTPISVQRTLRGRSLRGRTLPTNGPAQVTLPLAFFGTPARSAWFARGVPTLAAVGAR
jgi:hypothetical protein